MTDRKIGVIDAGGGNRGAYGAGVLDFCLDHGISFSCAIGVSAGSANLCAYQAGQRGRNMRFYTEYSGSGDYIGLRALARSGNVLDIDYVCRLEVSGCEDIPPLDFEAMKNHPSSLQIVATDVKTGKPVYFDKTDLAEDDFGAIAASSCVPIVCRPFAWHGGWYYDGGLSDPIPIHQAMKDRCDRIVVILTRPRGFYRRADKDRIAASLLGNYPAVKRALIQRAETYNRELDDVKNLERQGKALIIAPDSIGRMKTLSSDKNAVRRLYEKGWKDAEKIPSFLAG